MPSLVHITSNQCDPIQPNASRPPLIDGKEPSTIKLIRPDPIDPLTRATPSPTVIPTILFSILILIITRITRTRIVEDPRCLMNQLPSKTPILHLDQLLCAINMPVTFHTIAVQQLLAWITPVAIQRNCYWVREGAGTCEVRCRGGSGRVRKR